MRRRLGLLVVAGASLASLATSPSRQERNYPSWQLDGAGERTVGCASIGVEVGKSGKEGFGLLAGARATEPCEVTVLVATLELKGGATVRAPLPPALRLGPEQPGRLWLPFAFDAEERWNAGDRAARVLLRIRAGDAEEEWTLPAQHVLGEFHREREREGAFEPPPHPPPSQPPGTL